MRWKDYVIDKQEQEANEQLKHCEDPEPTEAEQTDIDLFNFNIECDKITKLLEPEAIWNRMVKETNSGRKD